MYTVHWEQTIWMVGGKYFNIIYRHVIEESSFLRRFDIIPLYIVYENFLSVHQLGVCCSVCSWCIPQTQIRMNTCSGGSLSVHLYLILMFMLADGSMQTSHHSRPFPSQVNNFKLFALLVWLTHYVRSNPDLQSLLGGRLLPVPTPSKRTAARHSSESNLVLQPKG